MNESISPSPDGLDAKFAQVAEAYARGRRGLALQSVAFLAPALGLALWMRVDLLLVVLVVGCASLVVGVARYRGAPWDRGLDAAIVLGTVPAAVAAFVMPATMRMGDAFCQGACLSVSAAGAMVVGFVLGTRAEQWQGLGVGVATAALLALLGCLTMTLGAAIGFVLGGALGIIPARLLLVSRASHP